jgi:16S rRNA (cytosine1402-N4)-methyltransferase
MDRGHRPVMMDQVLAALRPAPGEVAVDATLGAGGHAAELLRSVGPAGHLIACDLDPGNLQRARPLLEAVGHPVTLHATNFAALAHLAPEGADVVLADLGVSSMQIDDPGRGFSYRRDGPLDMRMDATRGRTAAQLLESIAVEELAAALRDFGDLDEFGAGCALRLAAAIKHAPPARTGELTGLVLATVPPPAPPPGRLVKPWQLRYRPVACTFQALRLLVNREVANLEALLRSLPAVLRPAGRAAIISFHSGEDRLVKRAFRDGLRGGVYSAVSADAERAGFAERQDNPRSRSAKLRWAVRAG